MYSCCTGQRPLLIFAVCHGHEMRIHMLFCCCAYLFVLSCVLRARLLPGL